ncbi:uncharacterized protein LOC122079532, partial [Macadamia integrifolia]|uniref:uncharacterized protein LOC122079532 n=1 Tax=Macadamia integrifolia TaxID=60698 RepID=UPI001C4F02F2
IPQAAIRETLVLPNCESICIPWMLAEKNDWVPRKMAPFLWVRQEAVDEPKLGEAPGDTGGELVATSSSRGRKQNANSIQDEREKSKNVLPAHPPAYESSESASSQADLFPSSSSHQSTSSQSLLDLRTPLLRDEPQESCIIQRRANNPDCQPTRAVIRNEEQTAIGGDARPRKIGKRERMIGLGKKMGEKLEEKRRHLEEKGRHIVEKMWGPS